MPCSRYAFRQRPMCVHPWQFPYEPCRPPSVDRHLPSTIFTSVSFAFKGSKLISTTVSYPPDSGIDPVFGSKSPSLASHENRISLLRTTFCTFTGADTILSPTSLNFHTTVFPSSSGPSDPPDVK